MNRFTRAALLGGAAPSLMLWTAAAQACASCGCTLTSDWLSQGLSGQPGTTFSLRYDYIPQSTLQSGTETVDRAAIALPTGREIERYTYNHVITATLDHQFASDWGIDVQTAQPAPPQPAPSARASVSVPREVLERYVGRYELNGTVATVSLTDDGQLTVQLTGQPPGPPLRAVSPTEFVSDAAGVRLFFEGEGPQTNRIRSRYRRTEVVGTRIADAVAPAPAGPPRPGPAPTSLDAAARKEVVSALGTALRQRYVFPDIGEKAASRIDAAQAAGEYDNLADPAAFAARLDADVSAIAHDKHLRIISMNAPRPLRRG